MSASGRKGLQAISAYPNPGFFVPRISQRLEQIHPCSSVKESRAGVRRAGDKCFIDFGRGGGR